MLLPPPNSPLFPYTTLFRSHSAPQALPVVEPGSGGGAPPSSKSERGIRSRASEGWAAPRRGRPPRSEEHTSELQSHSDLVCRLLLEKKKKTQTKEHIREPGY